MSAAILPIANLNAAFARGGCIRARVSDITPERTWSNARGQGCLFSLTLNDETASIRATFFGEGCKRWSKELQDGAVYFFTGWQVKTANARFNNVNNLFELSFDKEAEVRPCTDPTAMAALPKQRHNFIPFQVLKTKENYANVDLLGIVTKVDEPSSFQARPKPGEDPMAAAAAPRMLTKRNITLADSRASVELTMWGDEALEWRFPVGTVLAIKGARVNRWGGMQQQGGAGGAAGGAAAAGANVGLGTAREPKTQFEANPAMEDAKTLQMWFATTQGHGVEALTASFAPSASSTERSFFSDVEKFGLGRGDGPGQYMTVRCVPMALREAQSAFYEACKNPACKKKLVASPGGHTCSVCQRTYSNPDDMEYRYMTSLLVSDGIGSRWVTLFDEAAVQLWGMPASQFRRLDAEGVTQKLQTVLFAPMLMRLRVKEEQYTDPTTTMQRDTMRFSVMRVTYLDSAALRTELPLMIKNIQMYL